jgi:soluble lytic murein transglycosylase
MLDKYENSYPLAIAAYNGGPGRVNRWLKEIGDPRKGQVDMIDWMEMIPVYETRNYVQRVMEGAYIYRLKLRDIQKSARAELHVAFQN